MSNPYQMVYDSLWDMVESRSAIQALVRDGNRIKLNRTMPLKENIQIADTPELILEPTGSPDINIIDTSTTTRIERNYQWSIVSGTLNIETINIVEWELFRAMTIWCGTLGNLEWDGETFVNMANLIAAEQGAVEDEASRGILGWVANWQVVVRFIFRTDKLRNEGIE